VCVQASTGVEEELAGARTVTVRPSAQLSTQTLMSILVPISEVYVTLFLLLEMKGVAVELEDEVA